jgi:hypothetical protein
MASTGNMSSPLLSGYSELPGLRVGPAGIVISAIKGYAFGITSTAGVTATSSAINYTVSGLTTNDIPFSLQPSTGVWPGGLGVGSMFVGAANTLTVSWTENGTSTVGFGGSVAPGNSVQLLTYSYYNQSPSTTT